MNLIQEQIEFLDRVCKNPNSKSKDRIWFINSNGEVDVNGQVDMRHFKLPEIPVKFGIVWGYFYCSHNKLTTLNNLPNKCERLYCSNNTLTEYFKNIKEEDFKHWIRLDCVSIIKEYPFLINVIIKYFDNAYYFLNHFPLTKLYYKD
jgi:hypothetical protein